VAFAQIPEVATTTFKMKSPGGQQLDWLIQGIAWVDKLNFQVLQMRTDLLIHRLHLTDIRQLQTLVKFGETQPEGFATPVWLPSEADVNEVVRGGRFRNEHHFSHYRTLVNSNGSAPTVKEAEPDGLALDEIVSRDDKESHPYLEESLQELVKHIPELKGMRPATSSGALTMILEKTGKTVDDFFDNVVDLVAQEEIKQQRWRRLRRTEVIRDNYLILRRGNRSNRGIDEFRMDDKGNRIDQQGLDRGFFVTSGFALSCVHFSRAFQWDSRFRYLGDQKIDGRDAYVVGFAQLPEEAGIPVTLRVLGGTTVHMFVQGISWVDKTSFHILRMRTDLLARHPDIGLDEQTTKVKFSEVRLAGGGPALWLPRDVDVEVKLGKSQQQAFEETFRNLHRYKNYQRYRVSARIVTSQ
jgi:hypothetical protein